MKRTLLLLTLFFLLVSFSFSNLIWPGPPTVQADDDYCPSYYAKAWKAPQDMTWFRASLFGGAAIPQTPEELSFNFSYAFQLEYQATERLLVGVEVGQFSYSVEGYEENNNNTNLGGEGRVFLFPIGTKGINPYVIGLVQGVNLAGITYMGEGQNDWVFDTAIGMGTQFELHEGVSIDAELRYLNVEENKGLLFRVGPSFPFGL